MSFLIEIFVIAKSQLRNLRASHYRLLVILYIQFFPAPLSSFLSLLLSFSVFLSFFLSHSLSRSPDQLHLCWSKLWTVVSSVYFIHLFAVKTLLIERKTRQTVVSRPCKLINPLRVDPTCQFLWTGWHDRNNLPVFEENFGVKSIGVIQSPFLSLFHFVCFHVRFVIVCVCMCVAHLCVPYLTVHFICLHSLNCRYLRTLPLRTPLSRRVNAGSVLSANSEWFMDGHAQVNGNGHPDNDPLRLSASFGHKHIQSQMLHLWNMAAEFRYKYEVPFILQFSHILPLSSVDSACFIIIIVSFRSLFFDHEFFWQIFYHCANLSRINNSKTLDDRKKKRCHKSPVFANPLGIRFPVSFVCSV